GGDVRLRRHRLPPPAGDGTRRPARREAVHRLVERMDRGSGAACGHLVGRGYAPTVLIRPWGIRFRGFRRRGAVGGVTPTYGPTACYLPSLATSARRPACVSGSFQASMKCSR